MSIQTIILAIQLLLNLITLINSLIHVTSGVSQDVATQILAGLRLRIPHPETQNIDGNIKATMTATNLLNLETDFYDSTTCLYSEGVWHNSLIGIASLELHKQETPKNDILQMLDSLYKFSWDGVSFRRRSWSGNWDHSSLKEDSLHPPEQANYYRESAEHRCVQHGMALTFWSKVLLKDNWSGGIAKRYQEEERHMANQFLREFWCNKTEKWSTVSQTQGGGNTLRLSASSARQGVNDGAGMSYYRAVDQAVAVLACLEHIKVVTQQKNGQEDVKMLSDIVQKTCCQILSPQGFCYGNIQEAKTYLGLDRNRNFWHDGWTILALIKAREYIWPLDTNHGELQLLAMWNSMVDMYGSNAHDGEAEGFDGTFWHWPRELKDDLDNVRYCGNNALAFAIRRNLGLSSSTGEGEGQFWMFIDKLRGRDDPSRGLASVADVYSQVRLHPNSELAALLVWP